MRFPGFRLPKNQQFNYKPRYWDPKEEERQERQARIDMLQDGGVDAMKARISSTFKRNSGAGNGVGRATFRSRQVAKSNVTLVVIIAVLLVLSYFAIMVYLPQLEQMM